MKIFLGGLIIAIGILVAGASGLCSFYMVTTSDTYRTGSTSELLSMLPMIAIFGGLPFLAGVAMVFGGRSIIRDGRGDGGVSE